MSIQRVLLFGTITMLAACATVVPQPMPSQAPSQATPVASASTVQHAMTEQKPSNEYPVVAGTDSSAPMPMPAGNMPSMAAAAAPAMPMTPPSPQPKSQAMRKPTAPPHVAKPVVVEAPSATPAALLHAEISGTVELVAGRGQQVAAGDRAETAVYFVPKNGNVRARPGQYTVYTDNHDFKPAALAIPLGSTVTFTNLDDVRHSVYSATPGAAFDLGFQATGEKVAHVFGNQGFVLIGCKVHRTMELDMLVVPTSYVTRVAANGSFSLRDLPAGPGTLYFWNPRAGLASEPVTLPMTGAIHQRMTAIKPHVATELHVGSAP